MSTVPAPRSSETSRRRAGWLATLIILVLYGGLALTIDFPRTAGGSFHADEATYYMMGQSLVADGDLAYRRQDLERTWKEFPSGPNGVFLKLGREITGAHLTASPPFLVVDGRAERDRTRLFYGKAFIYPALAAPFIWAFGTNGFLLFNALLLAAAFFAAYLFVSRRSGVTMGLVLAGGFLFASVAPVYFVWMTPELFNFTLGLLAYFFWLHKTAEDNLEGVGRGWLYGPQSDWIAAGLMGIATYSKVSASLLVVPLVGWLLWQRKWKHALLTGLVWFAVTAVLFGINTAVTGDWNYQGGQRGTFYNADGFPFQTPDKTFEVGEDRARNAGRGDVIFDRQMFWTNLGANIRYVFVGRYSGIVPYFFPAIFAIGAFALTRARRTGWQWLVLASVVAQILLFIVTQPYTYFGSGGSVGNRYFMGAYGLCVFLLPPLQSLRLALVPWLVGGLLVGRLVLNPFYTSHRPDEHAKDGPLRYFPVELTNMNDLPTNTNRDQMVFWYGEDRPDSPGFQIYYLDDNVYLREADRSFWVRGDAWTEVLIKTDQPFRRLQLTVSAGPIATTATVKLAGKSQSFPLAPGASQQVTLELGPGFPYKKDRDEPAYVWPLVVSSGPGFVPMLVEKDSKDVRYLGVRVKPVIIP